MKYYEDLCVGCPKEMGCIGDSCPQKNVPVFECDGCGDDATIHIDDYDFCDECAHKYLIDEAGNLSVTELADALGIDYEDLMD